MRLPAIVHTSLACALVVVVALLPSALGSRTPVPAAATAGSADWPAYLHDALHSSANASESTLSPATAGQLHPLWTLHTPATIEASAIVAGSTVFIGSWDGNEYALDQATGAIKWTTYLGQTTSPSGDCNPPYSDTAGVTSSPTIQNGVAYLSGGDSYFYALDTTSGAILWRVFLTNTDGTGYYNYSSPVLANGFAYLGLASYGNCPSTQGAVVQIDLTTHQVVHRFNIVPDGAGGAIWSSPAYDAATNTVYVSTGEDNGTSNAQYTDSILALNASNLTLEHAWSIPHDSSYFDDADFGASPILFSTSAGQTLVGAANKNGHFYALDRATLQLVWDAQIGDQPGDNPVVGAGSISSAAFANGVLYVAGGHTVINGTACAGSLRALNPDTGQPLWASCEPGVVMGAVAYANGLVVIGAGNQLEVHDATSGALLYAYQESTDGNVFLSASPSLANGQILEGSSDGTLLAFGVGAPTPTATGSPGTPTNTPTPLPAPPVYVQGAAAVPQTAQRTVSVRYTSPQRVGDLNVVAVGWNDTTASISAVTDSAGNTYQLAVPLARGSGLSQALYYAPNIAASAATTVTVTFNQAAAYPDIRVMEYSNVDPTNPFDGGSTGAGSAATADSGAVSTTRGPDLLVGAGMTTGTFSAAGSGYTNRIITTPDGDIVEDRVVIASGSYHATGAVTGPWLMQVAAFRAATTGPAPTATATPTPAPAAHIAVSRTNGAPLQTIAVSGTNFGADEPVNLYWDSRVTTPLATPSSLADGSFATTLTIPQAIAGRHYLIARGQSSQKTAVVAFRVTPAVYVLPASGKAGSVAYLLGLGFGSSEVVAALWSPGDSVLNQASSNTVGTALVPFVVPARAPGRFYVTGYGESSKVFAVAAFTVTALSSMPAASTRQTSTAPLPPPHSLHLPR